MIDAFFKGLDELACGPEDLQLVVFSGGEHNPFIVLVPVEIGDRVCESAVHEESISLSVKDSNGKKVNALTVQGAHLRSRLASALLRSC
jgi:hypothetical protein